MMRAIVPQGMSTKEALASAKGDLSTALGPRTDARVPRANCEFCRRRPIEGTSWIGGISLKVCGNCAAIAEDDA